MAGETINKLAVYYGLAIRHNLDSVQKRKMRMMKNIWAKFRHYSSRDTNPNTRNIPPRSVHSYKPLPDNVLRIIKPIYEDLSKDKFLERCLGGFTQNNNRFGN